MTAIKRWYCMTFHSRITTPVRGKYICLHCLKEHTVNFK